MNKFLIPVGVVLVAAAFVVGFFLGKGVQTTDQSASIIRATSQGTVVNPGAPIPASQYVWANGTCWKTSGTLNGGTNWTATNLSLNDCPVIRVNPNAGLWSSIIMTSATIPGGSIKSTSGTTTPASIYVWKDGTCWKVQGNLNGGYNWSATSYDMNSCPAIKAPNSANLKN
jgi:hypothetical protein